VVSASRVETHKVEVEAGQCGFGMLPDSLPLCLCTTRTGTSSDYVYTFGAIKPVQTLMIAISMDRSSIADLRITRAYVLRSMWYFDPKRLL
jgi:hypothetical protein